MNDNQETQLINPETQTAESQPQQTEPQPVKESEPQPAEGNETAEESAKSDEAAKSDGVPETNKDETEKSEKSAEAEPKSPEVKENKEKSTEEEQKTEAKEETEVKEEPKKKMDEWCAKAIEDGMKVFEEVFPIEKWTLENESDGIRTLSRYDEATGLKMTRGEGEIARPLDQIKDVLMNPSEVLKWEGSLIANDIVEKTDEYTIIQSLDQKRAFVTQRETLIIIKSFQREDGSTVVIERSVENHPKFPERSEYVRAFVHLWACIMKPKKDDPTKTETSFIIFLDPKGWVPKALFNAVVNGQALNVQKLKTYLEKH